MNIRLTIKTDNYLYDTGMITPRMLGCGSCPSPRPVSTISHPCSFRNFQALHQFNVVSSLSPLLHSFDLLSSIISICTSPD
ncbi:cellulose synthase protein D3 [Trifolium repens]|nr:cellulose synthase protein D3 [Trifolium repens]